MVAAAPPVLAGDHQSDRLGSMPAGRGAAIERRTPGEPTTSVTGVSLSEVQRMLMHGHVASYMMTHDALQRSCRELSSANVDVGSEMVAAASGGTGETGTGIETGRRLSVVTRTLDTL